MIGDDPHASRPNPVGLTILDPDDDRGDDDGRRVVLITGASGNIGRKLIAAWSEQYEIVAIDHRVAHDELEIVEIDLANWDDEWPALFEGVDVVVHLAANPDEKSAWPDLVGPNIDATINVLNASALAGVDRFIFASSNHAMGDYRFDGSTGPITEDLPQKPDGPYGATKLMGERLGRAFSSTFEMEFIALRLGWNQRGNDNLPDTLPDQWSRQIWLSDADLVALFTRAVEAELLGTDFVVVNGMSDNTGSRWVQDRARSILGFEPRDDAQR